MKQKVSSLSSLSAPNIKNREHAQNISENMKNQAKDYTEYFYRGKESTKIKSAQKLEKFCRWIGKTPQQLIAGYETAKRNNDLEAWQRETINEILKYYNWLTEQISPRTKKKYSLNYCRTEPIGILAFHRQNTKQLPDVTKEFAPPQIPTDEYRFTQDDLRKMFYYGDTEEKALLSLAVSYGQGSKEFLELECQTLKNTIEEARDKNLDFLLWIGRARAKTSVQPRSFLTPEAIESTNEYLNLLEKKFEKLPKYLWCNTKPEKHITNQGLNKKLKRLVKKANIKTYNRKIKFHCIRKFTFSRLRRIDRDMAKIICGKIVSASDMTYEEINEQCEKVFRVAYKDISLNSDPTGTARKEQTGKIQELEKKNEELKKKLEAQNLLLQMMFSAFKVDKEAIEKAKKQAEEQGFLAEFETLIESEA